MHTQDNSQVTKTSFPNQRKTKAYELCNLSSTRQRGIQRRKANRLEHNQSLSTITKQKREQKTKLAGQLRTPNPGREARHT